MPRSQAGHGFGYLKITMGVTGKEEEGTWERPATGKKPGSGFYTSEDRSGLSCQAKAPMLVPGGRETETGCVETRSEQSLLWKS